MRRPTEPRAGFALLEVLAALVITATFVVVVLPFAVHLIARWGTGESEMESADAWMQAIDRLGDDVAEAVPIKVAGNGRRAVGFRADAGLIKLVRPSLQEGGKSSLETVTYSIVSKAAGDMLVRRARPFVADGFEQEQSPVADSAILDGPFRLRFSVVAVDGKRAEGGWHDRTVMPLRLELTAHALGQAPVPPAPIVLPIVARGEAAKPQGEGAEPLPTAKPKIE